MNIYLNPERSIWESLCSRSRNDDSTVKETVAKILDRVRNDGDAALKEISFEIDSYTADSFELTQEEIDAAYAKVSDNVREAIGKAAANIESFHKAQMPVQIEAETSAGVKCIQKPVAIQKVGLYIPGGTAPLFSTVLMLAIPAKIAGCNEIILCTPARKDGSVSAELIYAAQFCGVNRIFKIGGAQAIAAMAYGTQTIPKVYKIFGPGNRFVMTAKQMVSSSTTAIDMPAGPSEVMVIADNCSNPAYIAADLLSQAEHGKDSQVMLVCKEAETAAKTNDEMEKQLKKLGRAAIAEEALENSRIVIFDNDNDIIDFAEYYAPEHLIIQTSDPWKIANRICCAGSVFVGGYSPESAGDYASGTNHTLPTNGWAHSFSGVNIDSFMRKMTIQELSRKGLHDLADTIITMAEAEGLQAHANAVKVRLHGE